jgi:hypothetical protein
MRFQGFSANVGGEGEPTELVFKVTGGEKRVGLLKDDLELCLGESVTELNRIGREDLERAKPKKKPCNGCPDREHRGITNPMAFRMAEAFDCAEVLSRSQDAAFAEWESRMGVPVHRLPLHDFTTA